MTSENQEHEYHNNNVLDVLLGTLIGGLMGAVIMLLLAPQSGKDTRIQIQKKGLELRDRTTKMMDDAMAQARLDRNKFTMDGRLKAREVLHQGQELVVEQLEHVSEAALTGKKAIQNSQD